jgi:hypothetical protein
MEWWYGWKAFVTAVEKHKPPFLKDTKPGSMQVFNLWNIFHPFCNLSLPDQTIQKTGSGKKKGSVLLPWLACVPRMPLPLAIYPSKRLLPTKLFHLHWPPGCHLSCCFHCFPTLLHTPHRLCQMANHLATSTYPVKRSTILYLKQNIPGNAVHCPMETCLIAFAAC